MNDKDFKIISHLRCDARTPLTEISKKTQIPVSTIFDRIKQHEKENIIKHTTLLDFEKLGYNATSIFAIKTSPQRRALLKDYLSVHPNVNNFFATNSNFDYLIETVFRNQKETQHFIEEMERNFDIQQIDHYNLIENIHREKFLSE